MKRIMVSLMLGCIIGAGVGGYYRAMPDPFNATEVFKLAINHVSRWEGGLVDDKDDPGGITKFGIALRGIGRILGFNRETITKLSWEEAKRIYQDRYWKRIGLDKVAKKHPAIALFTMDSAINQGQITAIKFMQRACGAYPDGIVGPKTLACLDRWPEKNILDKMFVARAVSYARGNRKYHVGWYNRLLSTYNLAKEFINE